MSAPLESVFIGDDAAEAQHHADMLAFREEAENALRAALLRRLTPREVAAIAWWGNLTPYPTRPVPPVPRDGPPF
jgi:hypothetical protein